MSRLPALLMAACAAAAIAMAPATAAADTPPDKAAQAREMYENALRNFNVGKFAEAAESFKAAYEISGREDLLFNVAQAWRQAKNYEKALFFYKAYLAAFRRRGEWPPERALLERRMEEAEQAIAAARAAQPQPQPQPQPLTNQRQAETPTPQEQQQQRAASAAPEPPSPPPRWMRPLGIGLVAVGVAGLAVGGAMAGLAQQAASDVQKASGEFDRGLYDKQQLGLTYQSTAIGLFAAGGALVVAGVVPLALSFRRPRSYALAPAVAPGALGLSFAGRF